MRESIFAPLAHLPQVTPVYIIKDKIVAYSIGTSSAISFGSPSSILHVKYLAGCRLTKAYLQQTMMQKGVILASQHPATDQTSGMRVVVTRLVGTADNNRWSPLRPGPVTRLTHTALQIK